MKHSIIWYDTLQPRRWQNALQLPSCRHTLLPQVQLRPLPQLGKKRRFAYARGSWRRQSTWTCLGREVHDAKSTGSKYDS